MVQQDLHGLNSAFMFRWMGEKLSDKDGSIHKAFGRGAGVVELLGRVEKSRDSRNAIRLPGIRNLTSVISKQEVMVHLKQSKFKRSHEHERPLRLTHRLNNLLRLRSRHHSHRLAIKIPIFLLQLVPSSKAKRIAKQCIRRKYRRTKQKPCYFFASFEARYSYATETCRVFLYGEVPN